MRLLHVIPRLDPRYGGTVEAVRSLGLALQAEGAQQAVATIDPPEAPYLAAFPLPVFAQGPAKGFYGYSPRLVPWLRAEASAYDAVLVHGIWQFHDAAVGQACRGRVPYYVFTHGMLDPWFNRTYPLKHLKKLPYWFAIQRPLLHGARAVLYTAEEERTLARGAFPGYRPRELVCGLGTKIPEGDAEAQRMAWHEAFPALAERPFLLFLGRICEKKGVDQLVEAYAARPDWPLDLVLAGPGEQEPWAQTLRARFPHRQLHWLGPISGATKWGALRAAQALILPSHQENFGLVVAEALAMGTPALLTRQVNIWREVVEGGAGIAEADTRAGARALLETACAWTPEVRADLRERALACFQQHFRIEMTARRLYACLQDDLAR